VCSRSLHLTGHDMTFRADNGPSLYAVGNGVAMAIELTGLHSLAVSVKKKTTHKTSNENSSTDLPGLFESKTTHNFVMTERKPIFDVCLCLYTSHIYLFFHSLAKRFELK
jgi:hypothetical protein